MANTTTLADLRNMAKRRADMENSGYVSDAEWNDYINAAAGELHDILVSKFGDDYYIKSSTISVVAGTDEYTLPSDFLKIRGIDHVASNTTSCALRRFEFEERHTRQFLTTTISSGFANLMYRTIGNKLKLVPTPQGSGTLKLWYIPQFERLATDQDIVSDRLALSWEQFMVITAAIAARDKEESDTSLLMAEKSLITRRIEEAAANRDATEPHRVVDVERYYSDNIWDGAGDVYP